jgi:hypothetical protein
MSTITVDAARFEKLVAMEAKQKLSARKASVKIMLFVEKAKELGIEVTKAEIDARIAAEDAKKVNEAAPITGA